MERMRLRERWGETPSTGIANAQGYATKLTLAKFLYTWTKMGARELSISLDETGLNTNANMHTIYFL